METKLKSRQWHLAGTLPRGGTLPRVTNNAMCYTKDLTGDILKKNSNKI